MFRKGDSVTVTTGDAAGKTGTVKSDGSNSGGLMGISGLDNKIVEAVRGVRGNYAEDLKPKK